MKSVEQVERALRLSDAGWNNCQISREIEVNRKTISDWVKGRTRHRRPLSTYRDLRRREAVTCPRCPGWVEFLPGITAHAYAYLLGLYLGDGTLSRHPRAVFRLRIFLDRAYPLIVAETRAALGIVLPASAVNVLSHKTQRTYAYPRYFFSNRSLDIQGIFCEACDRLGVGWRQDGPWNISVARPDAVAILDRHIGRSADEVLDCRAG